jgi:acetyl-CoA carboxylase carboxyl transferase subunit alpha
MIVGQQKDITKTRQYRNFGMANPEGYRNAALDENGREVWYSCSDAYRYSGAYPGLEAERGQMRLSPEIYLKWYV